MKPLINILTRTSGRPNFFRDLAMSIENQTYDNVRWIVHADNYEEDKEYLQHYLNVDRILKGDSILKLKSAVKNFQHNAGGIWRCYHAPYNLYFDRMHKAVTDGWVVYLDDDDMLASEDALERLAEAIARAKEDNIIIFNADINGKTLPNHKGQQYILQRKEPPYGTVGGICFAYHCKHATEDLWDEWSCSDARCLGKLLTKLTPIYLPYTITETQSAAGNGQKKDL